MINHIIVSGPQGCGKSTLIKQILQWNGIKDIDIESEFPVDPSCKVLYFQEPTLADIKIARQIAEKGLTYRPVYAKNRITINPIVIIETQSDKLSIKGFYNLKIKAFDLSTKDEKKEESEVTRVYCDGGRWVNIGTPVYLVPTKGAKLNMVREYKTELSTKHDTYRNSVCMNENHAINVIKSQMNIFQWIIAKYK